MRSSRLAARHLALVALSLVTLATPAAAQPKPRPVPPRPALAKGADTNDAAAYLALAREQVEANPRKAIAAYTWALRLDPSSAEALDGLAIATLMDDDGLFNTWMRGPRDRKEAERTRVVDSLMVEAELINPFLDGRSQMPLVRKARRGTSGFVEVDNSASRDYEGARYSDYVKGWSEYRLGYLQSALKWWGSALGKEKVRAPIHALRGRVFQVLGQSDSAIASLKLAIKEYTKGEDSSLVFFYQPKARFFYQLGWIYEGLGRTADAKEAYGQALTEDLSFYPAHQRLALIALAANDSATAIAEFDIATQAGARDAVLRVQYAYALSAARRLGDAAQQLQEVIAHHPDYADPYLLIARLYEATDMADLAQVQYQAFLARASRTDVQRPFATERLAALGKPAGTP